MEINNNNNNSSNTADEEARLRNELENALDEKRRLVKQRREVEDKLETAAEKQNEINSKLQLLIIDRLEAKYTRQNQRIRKLETQIRRLNASLPALTMAARSNWRRSRKRQQRNGAKTKPRATEPQKSDDKISTHAKMEKSSRAASLDAETAIGAEDDMKVAIKLEKLNERLESGERLSAMTHSRQLNETMSTEAQELARELGQGTTGTGNADHVTVLKAMRDKLATRIVADNVAFKMFQRNAMTLNELTLIKSKRAAGLNAAQKLVNFLLEQPYEVYECFLEVLKESDYTDLYERLVNSSFKAPDDASCPDHVDVIRLNYVLLWETLDAKFSGLVYQLTSDNVLDHAEAADVEAEMTSTRRNEKLLAILSRKSPQQFQLFLEALDKTGQGHLRNVITGTEADQDSEPEEQTTNYQEHPMRDETSEDNSRAEQDSKEASTRRYPEEHSQNRELQKEPFNEEREQDHRLPVCEKSRESASSKDEQSAVDMTSPNREIAAATEQQQQQQREEREQVERSTSVVYGELPEAEPVYGVTTVSDELYVLRSKTQDQVEVYETVSFQLRRRLSVPELKGIVDMASCQHHRCLYICDYIGECVHRFDLEGRVWTRWPTDVSDRPHGLSVTADHHVIVTTPMSSRVREYSTSGDLIREIPLPSHVLHPCHTVQLFTGQFAICHGTSALNDPVHRVCIVDADGQVIRSYGGAKGSDVGHLNRPAHLTVDGDGFIFVADNFNRRVVLLDPMLNYVRDVVTADQLRWYPHKLCLDNDRKLLYVGEREWADGRVLVISLASRNI